MDCALCGKPIREYDHSLNHLEIDKDHSADLCPDCIKLFMKWQGEMCARLFPTSAMKKRYGQGQDRK